MKEYLIQRKRVLLLGSLVLAVSAIPYLLGYFAQGEGWHFTGFLIGVEDGNSYIAKMLSGAAGNWLFRSPYSAEEQTGALIFFPYLLLGKLTAGPGQHEQLVVLFQAYRILAGFLCTLALDDFLRIFIKDNNRRLAAVGLILVGGGLGWIIAIAGMKDFLGSIPLDFLSPESFGFLAIFGLPHLSLARALLLWGLGAYLEGSSGYRAGLFWLGMGFFQPMNILIVWIVCGFQALLDLMTSRKDTSQEVAGWDFRSSTLKRLLQAVLVSSPMVIYNVAIFNFDPYLAGWTAQNNLPSPHWGHYLIAYGAVLPLAIAGISEGIRISRTKGLLLAAWLIVFPFLVYAPVNTQRRLSEGIWVVLIIGMFLFFGKRDKIPVYGKALIACLLPTSVFILWGASGSALNPSHPSFRSADEVAAYQRIAEIAPSGSVILSTFEVGNSLPAWAPVQVVIGHGPETINLNEWQSAIDQYFSNSQGDLDCGDFFYQNGIDYLFWGPGEEGRWNWDPGVKLCLSQVYNSKGYQIYQVAASQDEGR